MRRDPQLGTDPVGRLLVHFTGAALVGLVAHALYNIVDRIFVGHFVGPEGLGGLTVAFPLMLTQIAFVQLVAGGAATLIPISLGRRDPDRAHRALGNMVGVMVGTGVVLAIAGLVLLDPILDLLGTAEAVRPFARDYLQVILGGLPLVQVGIGLTFTLRGAGRPRLAAMIMVASAALNIALDPVFIEVLGMGVRGAAVATLIAQVLALAWGLGHFLRGRGPLALRLRDLRPRWHVVREMLSLGFAPFLIAATGAFQNALLNERLMARGGKLGIAAMGVVFAVRSLSLMIFFGIGDGMLPIVGFNYGAEQPCRVRRTLLLAMGAALAAGATVLAGVELAPGAIAGLFMEDAPELEATTVTALRLFAPALLPMAFFMLAARYFQAVHRPRTATLLGITRQLVLFVPAVLLLSRAMGLEGIWLALPVTDLGAALLALALLGRDLWQTREACRVEGPGPGVP